MKLPGLTISILRNVPRFFFLMLVFSAAAQSVVVGQAPPAAKLSAFWDFNDASVAGKTMDKLHGFVGTLERGAVATADQAGRSSQAGDRAMDFGSTTASQLVRVRNVGWLNMVSADDQMTVAFWQKLTEVANSSAFWMASPSSSGTFRGAQAHSPYGNRNLYFDTAGCCDASTQRLQASIDDLDPSFDFTQWHHFAYVKNGSLKQIWVDGMLLLEGENTGVLPTDFSELVIGADAVGGNSMRGILDDFAIFSGPLAESQILSLAQGASPLTLDPDGDSDGIPDWWEDENGLQKANNADAALDSDSDGLTNLQEYQRATNAKAADSDGDGLNDGVETETGIWVSATNTGTSPTNPDTDADGVKDGAETNTGQFVDANNTGSNPLSKDSDNDKFPDGTETLLGASPSDSNSTPIRKGSVNLVAFWDFNDASNAERTADKIHGFTGELANGALFTEPNLGRSGQGGDRAMDFGPDSAQQLVQVKNAHWLNVVSAQDQMTVSFWESVVEVANSSSFWMESPSSSGTLRGAQAHAPYGNRQIYFDTAGCCDGGTQRINRAIDAINPDFDFSQWHHYVFVKNGPIKQIWIDGQLFHEGRNTAPLPSDFVRLILGADVNGGNSLRGLMDEFAIFASALDPSQIAALAEGKSPQDFDRDTDGDGMTDVWEIGYALNKDDKADAALDSDSDGSVNLQEFLKGTDPKNADTDGDGLKDGVETMTGIWASATDTGTNPVDADTDSDGLRDNVETNTGAFANASNTGTNPLVKDSDGDGMGDGVEVLLSTSPVDASSSPVRPGSINLIAYWDFNSASVADKTSDKLHGITGTLENGAAYSADMGGRSGRAGDRAVDFGIDNAQQLVRFTNAVWINAASASDRMTVVFWQQTLEVANSSAFWMSSAASSGSERGFQSHVPWGDRTIYFDTSGCCDTTMHRISASIDTMDPNFDFSTWHHFALVKNGPQKQVWIDGKLFLEGTSTLALPTDFYQLVMGAEPTGINSMRGLLDDFAVFGSALDAAQIGVLAQGGIPTDLRGSAFSITQATLNATTRALSITWESVSGQKYTVQRSSNLKDWTTVTQVDAAAGSTTTFTDGNIPSTATALFYRVQR